MEELVLLLPAICTASAPAEGRRVDFCSEVLTRSIPQKQVSDKNLSAEPGITLLATMVPNTQNKQKQMFSGPKH